MRVVVLEAGGDPRDGPGLPEDYDVPAFHPLASENPAMRWDFFVQHYADAARQRRDRKLQPEGIYYPRAGTLGGCTAHNAMILMAPHDSDWDGIAALTGDASWRAPLMRRYFQRLEACRYRPVWRALSRLGLEPDGTWLGRLAADRMRHAVAGVRGPATCSRLSRVLRSGCCVVHRASVRTLRRLLQSRLDPNDRRLLRRNADGLCFTPLSTDRHQRVGTRERLLDVAARHPDRLRIELNALATRVLFDADNRAIGVEYLKGDRLYRAHPRASDDPGERRVVHAGREVILAGGAFNTPQLLMLSGIGPREALERHGIAGAGGPARRRPQPAGPLRDRRGQPDGAAVARAGRRGLHARRPAVRRMVAASHRHVRIERRGARGVAAVAAASAACRTCSAWRCWRGSRATSRAIRASSPQHHDYLTWAVLKAHTNNRAGEVTLRSADPRDTPLVNFRYFEEGSDTAGDDLQAVVTALRFVRRMTQELKRARR